MVVVWEVFNCRDLAFPNTLCLAHAMSWIKPSVCQAECFGDSGGVRVGHHCQHFGLCAAFHAAGTVLQLRALLGEP